jgi:hypothetical protein
MGRFKCHPALCGPYALTEKFKTIEFVQQDRDHAILKYAGDPVRIATQYLQKLVRVLTTNYELYGIINYLSFLINN